MNVFSSLELLGAHRWSRALFTTYSLSLAFFESVVLDSLVRQQVSKTLILSDVEGIRASFSEYGVRSAGRSYDIEPVSVKGGCFHPKLTVLTSETEAHVVVGSGNLTFGGWGSNLECVEHLHPGFACDAIEDIASFLATLPQASRLTLAAGKGYSDIADQLRALAAGRNRNGAIRVIHNLNSSLLDQVADLADDMGGATKITAVSPFYNDAAISKIRTRLRVEGLSLHVHEAGTVSASAGLAWPTNSSHALSAVNVEWCEENPPRLLHAKVFEILCRQGRILVSGSANGTLAAWDADRNVELCVVRLEVGAARKWVIRPTNAPTVRAVSDGPDGAADEHEGVLRATMTAGQIEGLVLTPFPAGPVRVLRLTAAGEIDAGSTRVGLDRRFTFKAGELELHAWGNERFLLRIVAEEGTSASGYIMFADLSDIRARVGAASGSFFALLAGTETPADVAAIMDWFHDHPSMLSLQPEIRSGTQSSAGPIEASVDIQSLFEGHNDHAIFGLQSAHPEAAAWCHFLRGVIQSFGERRGPMAPRDEPIGTQRDEPTEDEQGSTVTITPEEKATPLLAFDRLFNVMLKAPSAKRDLILALRITNYVCDRIQPDESVSSDYLRRLVVALMDDPPKPEGTYVAAAAALLWSTRLNAQTPTSLARNARGVLLRMRAGVSGELPNMSLVQGFADSLGVARDFKSLWEDIRSIRTPQEEVRAYRIDKRGEIPDSDYPFLSTVPEWRVLKVTPPEGTDSNGSCRSSRVQILSTYSEVCPFCRTMMPECDKTRLKTEAVVTHCGRVLLCEEI